MNRAGAVLLRSAQTVGQQGKTEKEVLIQGCRDEQCWSSASEVGTDGGATRKNRKKVLIQGCRDEQCRSSASEVSTDGGTTRKNRKRSANTGMQG